MNEWGSCPKKSWWCSGKWCDKYYLIVCMSKMAMLLFKDRKTSKFKEKEKKNHWTKVLCCTVSSKMKKSSRCYQKLQRNASGPKLTHTEIVQEQLKLFLLYFDVLCDTKPLLWVRSHSVASLKTVGISHKHQNAESPLLVHIIWHVTVTLFVNKYWRFQRGAPIVSCSLNCWGRAV